jgi:hypothetical protein
MLSKRLWLIEPASFLLASAGATFARLDELDCGDNGTTGRTVAICGAQCETLCDSSINASRDWDREHTPLICRLCAHVEGANSVNFAYCCRTHAGRYAQPPKHRDTCDTCVSRPALELHVFPTATRRVCRLRLCDVGYCCATPPAKMNGIELGPFETGSIAYVKAVRQPRWTPTASRTTLRL